MIVNYTGRNKIPAHCDVQVFEGCNEWKDKKVAIITELKSNKGMSVTNCITRLTSYLKKVYNLADDTVWVEYYEGERYYSIVEFQEGSPTWLYLDKKDLEKNICALQHKK